MKSLLYLVARGALVVTSLAAPRLASAVCLGAGPNGQVAPAEECDDNNLTSGDGCSPTCTIEGENSCARALSFANLDVENFTGSTATWTLAPDNSTGTQTINTARPTVALFGQSAMLGTYAVRVSVDTTADDDFIGFALGFEPNDQNSAAADYLVIDWKQLAQPGNPGTVEAGMELLHVKGIPFAADHMDHGIAQRRCDNATTSCVRALAGGRRFASTGWTDFTPYTAHITYRPDYLEIRINNIVEFAAHPSDFPGEFAGGVFPAGQVGLYTHSQEQVQFTNLAPVGPSACNLTTLEPATYDRPLGTPGVVINTAGQLVDAGDALAPASVAVLGIVGAATATVAANGSVTVRPTNPNVAATYLVDVFACDNDPVIPDCDVATFTIRYSPDVDGDGVLDAADLDDDNDGIPDLAEGGTDTDGDERDDAQDLDSDNDGLPDVVEAGHTGTDADGNGQVDCPGGVGANGLCDALETAPDSGVAVTAPVDTDGDGTPDFRDLDADDDAIVDRDENGTPCADAPFDGVCDGTDGDSDGVVASADGTVGFGVGGYPPAPDTDGDGTPDYRDLDSDGDSIPDVDESSTGGDHDADGDGHVDGPDTDGDGIKDPVDGTPTFGSSQPQDVDTDDDGTPDVRDPDSDGDGLTDEDEAGPMPTEPQDTDDDGQPDFQDPDSDGDGVGDGTDNCAVTANPDQADADADGTGDACEGLTGDDLGVRGGGCGATTGGASSGLVLVIAALMVGGRRRRRFAATVATLGVLALVRPAAAQVASTFPAERFQLAAHRDGLLGVEWADVHGHLAIDGALWLGYANDPVTVYRTSTGDRVGSLVKSRFGGELVATVHLWDRLALGLGAPLIVAQSEDLGTAMNLGTDLSGFGLGDLRLMPKVTLVRRGGTALALYANVTLPTSTSDDYGGDDGVTVSPALAVSHGRARGLRLAFNAGYRTRPETRSLDLVVDDEVFAQAGAGYRFPSSLELDATVDLATAANDMFGAANRNAAEIRGGAAIDATDTVRLFAAVGAGVAEGFATPDWRVLVGVRLHSPDAPAARAVAPPVDTNRDVVVEDTDPDHDGVIADADACPTDPEDVDTYEDTDGCPDLDNDGDTIADAYDRCPLQPGVIAMQGCPDPDRDGDTVVDRLDNCPDVPGTPERLGCTAPQLVKLVGDKLEILDIVYFSLDKALIQPRSFKLLDAVADVLQAHPEITKVRVEGHTDSKGNDAYNKALSQRRAEAVMAHLVRKGIAPDRLEATGYGEDRPKGSNDTKEGRAANRRVEFTIVGGAGVGVKATGPGDDTLE